MVEPNQEVYYMLPASVRDNILAFFRLPDVIAPTSAVLTVINSLGQLKPVNQTNEKK